MIQCLHCQTVLFVDFSGNIIVGGSEEESREESLVDIELPQDSYSQIQVPEGEQGFSAGEPSEPESAFTEGATNSDNDGSSGDRPFSSDSEELAKQQSYSFDSQSQELETPAPWEQDFSQANPDTQFSAGSPPKMGDLGTTMYRINIAGIDSSDLRKSILAALLDHRLGLVNDEVSDSISDGQVTISGLNAIKASYIINSLKAQPIELKWEVYVESDSESKI
jgi:hypothetical protein